jgi:MFS family permease
VLISTRALRAFGDGLVSTALPGYLLLIGLSNVGIGLVSTAMLAGSAVSTLVVGLRGNQWARRPLLQVLALVMAISGVAYAGVNGLWMAVVVGALGTLNPTSGDVSAFLPAEQALLPSTVNSGDRTSLFARVSVVAFVCGSVGTLAAAIPELVARNSGVARLDAMRAVFVVYALVGVGCLLRYRSLSPAVEPVGGTTRQALGPSRRVVYRLAAVFSLDSLAGGLVVQSMLVLWLAERHGLSTASAAAVLSVAGVLSGLSALAAPALARRIGLVRTMVFTHLPANALLVVAALAPTAKGAIAALLLRACLSQMDVPARQSLVMSVVTPVERAAAAAVTNVPRSLASALTPFAAGWMLQRSSLGWPLVLCGVGKGAYDLILLVMFRHVETPDAVKHSAR